MSNIGVAYWLLELKKLLLEDWRIGVKNVSIKYCYKVRFHY